MLCPQMYLKVSVCKIYIYICVYRHVRFIYNLEMHKQVDMLCQHRWLNSSATKFLFLPQQANHHSHFGPLPGARPSSSAPILCVPRMNPCAGNLGPTNIHIRFIILAKVYITILFPCYINIYIYTYVCIFHHHPILTFLLSFIHRAFVNHWIVHRALSTASLVSSSSFFAIPYVARF